MDWQERYALGDTPWDKGAAAPSLDYLIRDCPVLFTSEAEFLVPGCGLGHDALLLASSVGHVVGGDIAPLAVESAAQKAEAIPNLDFMLVNLFDLPNSMLNRFDGVWEHTCFCAIDPSQRAAYVTAMWSALRPAGYLLGIFFINPDVEPGEGPPFGASVGEICEVFSPCFTLEQEMEPKAFYPGREQRERILIFRRKD